MNAFIDSGVVVGNGGGVENESNRLYSCMLNSKGQNFYRVYTLLSFYKIKPLYTNLNFIFLLII